MVKYDIYYMNYPYQEIMFKGSQISIKELQQLISSGEVEKLSDIELTVETRYVVSIDEGLVAECAEITSQVDKYKDNKNCYVLKDWQQEGLVKPSVVKLYNTAYCSGSNFVGKNPIGHLSERDIEGLDEVLSNLEVINEARSNDIRSVIKAFRNDGSLTMFGELIYELAKNMNGIDSTELKNKLNMRDDDFNHFMQAMDYRQFTEYKNGKVYPTKRLNDYFQKMHSEFHDGFAKSRMLNVRQPKKFSEELNEDWENSAEVLAEEICDALGLNDEAYDMMVDDFVNGRFKSYIPQVLRCSRTIQAMFKDFSGIDTLKESLTEDYQMYGYQIKLNDEIILADTAFNTYEDAQDFANTDLNTLLEKEAYKNNKYEDFEVIISGRTVQSEKTKADSEDDIPDDIKDELRDDDNVEESLNEDKNELSDAEKLLKIVEVQKNWKEFPYPMDDKDVEVPKEIFEQHDKEVYGFTWGNVNEDYIDAKGKEKMDLWDIMYTELQGTKTSTDSDSYKFIFNEPDLKKGRRKGYKYIEINNDGNMVVFGDTDADLDLARDICDRADVPCEPGKTNDGRYKLTIKVPEYAIGKPYEYDPDDTF